MLAGSAPDVVHDVDLAAGGPALAVDVRAEHPERGPQALAARDLDAGFEASVRLCEAAFRRESRRRVVARDAVAARESLGARGDDERAAADDRALGAVGIGLEFEIAPAGAAVDDGPGAVPVPPPHTATIQVEATTAAARGDAGIRVATAR
jgi:hypothetical protein